MTDEEKVYKEALNAVDELVQEVLARCDAVAEANHFEPEWVLDRFKERFGRAKRQNT